MNGGDALGQVVLLQGAVVGDVQDEGALDLIQRVEVVGNQACEHVADD